MFSTLNSCIVSSSLLNLAFSQGLHGRLGERGWGAVVPAALLSMAHAVQSGRVDEWRVARRDRVVNPPPTHLPTLHLDQLQAAWMTTWPSTVRMESAFSIERPQLHQSRGTGAAGRRRRVRLRGDNFVKRRTQMVA